jgi:Asp-tRNA(Asn)/Glu-tRNA(Gln) amidotransferase C subunit
MSAPVDGLSGTELRDRILARLEELNPGERRLAQLRLDRILRRKRAIAAYPSPGHLAKLLAPDTVQTRMMTALDQVAIAADSGFQRRWIISTPPQEGKTMRMGTAVPLWFLMRDPTRRIVVASYEQSVAGRSTLAVRQGIESYGGGYKGDRTYANQDDQLGLLLDPDRAQQTNWNLIDGPGRRNGGMIAVGVGGALTGRSADVMIIDDAVKNSKQADNPTQRQMIWEWYQAVATTRLSPGAIVIVIGTRWHEDDLIGRLLAQDEDSRRPLFRHLIIPAIAKGSDPLGREPGEYLVSTRGRSPAEWDEIRRQVGERFWAALYMGEPSPPAGGVFQLAWLNQSRVPVAPELTLTEVYVDPADNEGDGDEAGVITMGRGSDQELYVLSDDSSAMTSGRWFRVAYLSAVKHDASAIRYEKSLSGLRRIARKAWKDLLREARKLDELDPFKRLKGQRPHVPDEAIVYQAARELARDDAEPEEIVQLERDLNELWPLVPKVLQLPVTGIPVTSFPAKGTKTYRAKMIAPMVEWRKVHLVGGKHAYPELVHQLVSWQESQDSPDRMDAFVHGVTRLGQSSETVIEPPTGSLPSRRPATSQQQLLRQGVTRRTGRYR